MCAKDGREAEADINVSPAMIDAGARALESYDPTRWSAEENAVVIANVYRAMERARRKSLK